MRQTTAVLAAVVLACGAVVTHGAEPMRTGSVLLTLESGVSAPAAGTRETCDMELELTLKDGQFAKPVWAYAVYFNRADHEGEVVSAEGDKLAVKLTLNPDKWYPKAPGAAEYQITIKRDGDEYAGTYTGTFVYPGIEKRELKGKVTGKAYPLWSEAPAGFKKLETNEHPRLIFRKSDLPMLKKRLETPEGKAIMERFLAVLPKQYASNQKNQAFFPAGYGLAYQLTGDKTHADKAKELMEGMLNLGGAQDIHYGPEAQSMAVTLDFCYDGWDLAFRQKVIDNLAKRTVNLFKGENIGTFAPNPWHNHNGVRAPSAGVAAICLLGEKTSDGKEIPGIERMIHILARDTRRYFRLDGTSNSGFCLEGNFYKRMTWNSGPGNMVQAYRTALGGDLMAGWWGHWSMLGEWMGQPPSDQVVAAEGLGDDQSAGLWPIGLVTVPDPMKAGARWLFDRTYGLNGNKTFGILWGYHAGYVLMNYPFDVAPRPPAESLPWVAPDPTGGHWIFRKPWKDGKDTLVVFQLRSGIHTGCHYERSGRTWDMQLFALGRQWVGDRNLPEGQGAGCALPTVGNPGAFNDLVGAVPTYWQTTDDGKAILSMDMEGIYMTKLEKGVAMPAGASPASYARLGSFADLGVRAKRYVALDLSGACGAPVLFVIVDQTKGAQNLTWKMKLAAEAGSGKVDGNTVLVGDPAGANLKCTFLTPKTPTLTGTISATGGDDYFAVITIQNGAAPEMKVDGEGLPAKVTVGGQAVSFDGAKVVLGK